MDYDNDGIADSFSELDAEWQVGTGQFVSDLRARLGPDFPIVVNGDGFVPPLEDFQGIKLEDLMRRNDWGFWKDFYVTPPGRRGYVYARDHCAGSWDRTLCHLQFAPEDTDAAVQSRWVRFGLGFSLLGDGFFAYQIPRFMYPWYDGPQVDPWFPEFDYDLGDSATAFEKQIIGPGPAPDTVYVRRFYDLAGRPTGMVEVNPNLVAIDGIPPRTRASPSWIPRERPRCRAEIACPACAWYAPRGILWARSSSWPTRSRTPPRSRSPSTMRRDGGWRPSCKGRRGEGTTCSGGMPAAWPEGPTSSSWRPRAGGSRASSSRSPREPGLAPSRRAPPGPRPRPGPSRSR